MEVFAIALEMQEGLSFSSGCRGRNIKNWQLRIAQSVRLVELVVGRRQSGLDFVGKRHMPFIQLWKTR